MFDTKINAVKYGVTMLTNTMIQEFKCNLRGELIQPGDENYDEARQLYNGMIDKWPRLIARCADVTDVITAVNFGRENNLLIAIRGGGHNGPGLGSCDDGLVINLSSMKEIEIDRQTRTVRVGPGSTQGEVDEATHAFGLAVPAGIVASTGIAGLTLGGGHGYLSRKYGLTIDNLIEADVVLADGTLVTANELQHSDLFWALRGGGGNFGVVTSFEYQLHPVGQWLAGTVVYPRSQARDILRYHRDFSQACSDSTTTFAGLMTSPDGAPIIALPIGYHGPLAEGERVLAPLRRLGTPLFDDVGPKSYAEVQSIFNPAVFPHGMQRYWKSSFLKNPPDAALDIALEYADQMASPHSMILLYLVHGAASRVPSEATAFGLRDTLWNLDVIGQWTDQAAADQHIPWVRECWKALDAHSMGGVYVNHLGADEPERVRDAYGHNYARVVKVKQQYDPRNVFRFNQNIRPTV
jgi:FAD/FMN-containing dehydrogenase